MCLFLPHRRSSKSREKEGRFKKGTLKSIKSANILSVADFTAANRPVLYPDDGSRSLIKLSDPRTTKYV